MEAPRLLWVGAGCWLPSGTLWGGMGLAAGAEERGRSLEHPTVSSVKIPQIPRGTGLSTGAGIQCHLDSLGRKSHPGTVQQSEGILRV